VCAPAQYQFDTREWALKETQVSVMTAWQLAVSQENFERLGVINPNAMLERL
jgi:hypothetical protein